jgi:formamidopyrimidine-DNA glycosylase
VGRRLTRVEARRPDLRFPLPERFVERLEGARVEALFRRAKYLAASLDTGETLIAHLGMSGRFTIRAPTGAAAPGAFYFANGPDPTHTHVVFTTDAGDRIEYNDPRRFGFMDIAATSELSGCKAFRALGPEPLGPDFDVAALAKSVAGSRQPIKSALLDQSVVAGLGNIYVCEALHIAGISPMRRAGRVSVRRLDVLVTAIRAVLDAAIEAGGSSLKDFADAQGALGYFQHRFQVYDREGAACQREGCNGLVVRRIQSGRSTFYCPICQT